jgi:hypothetical protein
LKKVFLTDYVAHYKSPASAANRAVGSFVFASDAQMGSKANMSDARVRMLEIHGADALSWTIDKIERKTSKSEGDGQAELDFREPAPVKKRKRRNFDRGVV